VIRWDRNVVEDFLGRYLSEPKAHIFFDPPRRPMKPVAFGNAVARHGLRLDPRSQFLFRGHTFYMNGERLESPPEILNTLLSLADRRHLPPVSATEPLLSLLYGWYASGYLLPGAAP